MNKMNHPTTQVTDGKGAPEVPEVQRGTYILDDAKRTVYDRPDQHGEPEDSFSLIADLWADYLDIEIAAHEVCDLFILMKVARNREGVYHDDNPTDIAGYAENYARLRSQE